jgi:hypothetical protein
MATPGKITLRERFSYGFGDVASVLYGRTFMVYLTYFCTGVFGIAALAAGTMLGLGRSADAFFDRVLGMIADRTETRWGKSPSVQTTSIDPILPNRVANPCSAGNAGRVVAGVAPAPAGPGIDPSFGTRNPVCQSCLSSRARSTWSGRLDGPPSALPGQRGHGRVLDQSEKRWCLAATSPPGRRRAPRSSVTTRTSTIASGNTLRSAAKVRSTTKPP